MSILTRDPSRISPTAHYTGQAWVNEGLSDPAFGTETGRLMHRLAQPFAAIAKATGLPTLNSALLARHLTIDALLSDEIAAGRVTQVIEIAAGMSGRGLRFRQRFGDQLTYVEADLAEMAAGKRHALNKLGALGPSHRVVDFDALLPAGEGSLAELSETLESSSGLAIITEGLIPYFDAVTAAEIHGRIAATLARFAGGIYLSDLYLSDDHYSKLVRAFTRTAHAVMGGEIGSHARTADEAVDQLLAAGFASVEVVASDSRPETEQFQGDSGAALVKVIAARVHD